MGFASGPRHVTLNYTSECSRLFPKPRFFLVVLACRSRSVVVGSMMGGKTLSVMLLLSLWSSQSGSKVTRVHQHPYQYRLLALTSDSSAPFVLVGYVPTPVYGCNAGGDSNFRVDSGGSVRMWKALSLNVSM